MTKRDTHVFQKGRNQLVNSRELFSVMYAIYTLEVLAVLLYADAVTFDMQ